MTFHLLARSTTNEKRKKPTSETSRSYAKKKNSWHPTRFPQIIAQFEDKAISCQSCQPFPSSNSLARDRLRPHANEWLQREQWESQTWNLCNEQQCSFISWPSALSAEGPSELSLVTVWTRPDADRRTRLTRWRTFRRQGLFLLCCPDLVTTKT